MKEPHLIETGRVVYALAIAAILIGILPAGGAAAAWESHPGYRRRALEVRGRERPGFERLVAVEAGIHFTNQLGRERSILNRNLLNGSGVAAGDVDGDGWCDLYFCGLETPNALFRNLGDWRFAEITAEAGVACDGQDSTGAVLADVDGDGDLDLLVAALERGVRLFRNDGRGKFVEGTSGSGLLPAAGGTSMALADIDRDGDLDLYVAHYRPDTIADRPASTFRMQVVNGWPVVVQVNGQPATDPAWTNRFEVSPLGRVLERGLPDVLYRNDGKGRFTAVSFLDGTFLDEEGKPLKEPPRDWGLSVQFHDLDGNGAPDLYVCNDFYTPDRIWMNDGNGRFRALARNAIRVTSAFSMGVDCADLERDGDVDVFVVDMLSPDHRKRHVQLGERAGMRLPPGLAFDRLQVSRNTLQLNRGDGTFAETAYFAGVEASDWSWVPVFLDVDLDGFEDILVGNGVLRDFQNVDLTERMEAFRAGRQLSQKEIIEWIGRFPTLETPNLLYRNRGDGTFEETGEAWGFATPGISQGLALADLDNDGDLDVVVNNLLASPGLYRNATTRPRLAVRLKGAGANSQGIGTRIVVRGGRVAQSQEMIAGGRYLGGDQSQRTFAAESRGGPLVVDVNWRSGRFSQVEVEGNYLYEITEPADGPVPARRAEPAPSAAWFEEFRRMPEVRHEEAAFDESARQPMLGRYLDRLGPGVGWHDVDRDGWCDLVAGNGRGGLPIVLMNQKGEGFVRVTNAPFQRPLVRDQTSVLGVRDALLAGSSNYEDGSTNGGLVRIYDLQRQVAGDSLAGFGFACGPLALADLDADGDLDLFVGGRAVPGRYPEPADSVLFRNEGGRFGVWQRWEKLGCVSGAVFSDLDGDGTPELVLAADWSPIRVFRREGGEYREMTERLGLQRWVGWWSGVATGDFDGDGQLEIVASNWGLNSAIRTSPERPWRLHYGDLDDNGTVDLIESRLDPVLGKEVPELTFNLAREAIPWLSTRIPDYATYARSSIQEIYGDVLARTRVLEVNTLTSTIFWRRDQGFEGVPLPAEAQWAPAFGPAIGDLDGDGAEDLFLAQNFLAVSANESRVDAGRGLLLKGDGQGHWQPVSGEVSGLRIYGDQRGSALGDFDADGRVDLAVGRNGDSVRLFRNRHAAPGLRVRLRGAEGNPDGVGSQLRLWAAGVPGPVREVQAGSGYWSQNSAVHVLTVPGGRAADALEVRWPGGSIRKVPVPAGAREIVVDLDGSTSVKGPHGQAQ